MSKKNCPAAKRNANVIYDVLEQTLIRPGLVLEIASGTGQHAAFCCPRMPTLQWQPSDGDPEALPSIEIYRQESQVKNFLSPILLDVCSQQWPIQEANAIYCANMIHIAPWKCCLGLFDGAARILKKASIIILYGPFIQEGVATASSNLHFDTSLKERNSEWGIRALKEVIKVATISGFALEKTISMPANNLCVVFRRTE